MTRPAVPDPFASREPSPSVLRASSGLVLLAMVCLGSSSVAAQGEDRPPAKSAAVERLTAEGVAHFRRGSYREALGKFIEAFALFPDPALLYNIARSHESIGDLSAAHAYFKRCVEDAQAAPNLRAKCAGRMQVIQSAQESAAATPPSGAGSGQAQGAQAVEGAAGTTATDPDRPWPAWVKWASTALAAGLIVAGSTVFALGAADNDELEGIRRDALAEGVAPVTYAEAEELRDRADQRMTAGYVLWGVGAALGITAAVSWIVGRGERAHERAETARSLLLGPVAGGGLLVGLEGSL